MGNRFSRRPNVPDNAETEATEQKTSEEPALDSSVTQEVVKAEGPGGRIEECLLECQQVVDQTNIAELKPEVKEVQAPVEPEQALAQVELLKGDAEVEVGSEAILQEALSSEIVPEPEAKEAPELVLDAEVSSEVVAEADSTSILEAKEAPEPVLDAEESSAVVPEADSNSSSEAEEAAKPNAEESSEDSTSSLEPEEAPKPVLDAEKSSELVAEVDSTSSSEAMEVSESAEPDVIACLEADVEADPIPNSEPEIKPGSQADSESESSQSSEAEEEPTLIPEPMTAEDNEMQPDLLAQESLPEQLVLIPSLVDADITNVTPSSAPIADDEPSDSATDDQCQEEEPAECLEPKEPEETAQEPLVELQQACNDVDEESVCESLKKLDLKGKEFVDDLIASGVDLSTDPTITDLTTSTELM